jgi:hypothetical protein
VSAHVLQLLKLLFNRHVYCRSDIVLHQWSCSFSRSVCNGCNHEIQHRAQIASLVYTERRGHLSAAR